jgi:hypothetical protein
MPFEPRPITPEEVAVLRATFAQGEVTCAVTAAVLEALPSLSVVSQCACGCASVDFAEMVTGEPRPQILVDAVAGTPGRDAVGLIVWGHPDAITALEIYDQSGGDANKSLPDLASIQSFFPI